MNVFKYDNKIHTCIFINKGKIYISGYFASLLDRKFYPIPSFNVYFQTCNCYINYLANPIKINFICV